MTDMPMDFLWNADPPGGYSLDENEWECQLCGVVNAGKYCAGCGVEREEEPDEQDG